MTAAHVRKLFLAAALPALLCLGGCQLPMAMGLMMFPNETVAGKYKLPADATLLVFPDDLTNPVSYPQVKGMLADEISKFLLEQHVVAKVIPYQQLADLHAAEPDFNHMSIARVGRRLGATVVLYINIDEFSLKEMPSDTVWKAKMAAKVRVVDVNKGLLWPDESAGYAVSADLPIVDNVNEAFGVALSGQLADKLAKKVIDLFRERELPKARPKEKEQEGGSIAE